MSFNQSLATGDVLHVTDMAFMFSNALAFSQSLNQWDVSQLTIMEAMLKCATAFNALLDAWDVSKVTTFSDTCLLMPNSFNKIFFL